jgi:hypothetical protein
MGSLKDVMELFAEREIRQLFSDYDGWKLTPADGSRIAGRFYWVSRYYRGKDEIALIGVSFDPEPSDESINALDMLPSSRGCRAKKYLLTPQATNISDIPPHIQVLHMNAFAFVEGNLIWLTKKKNAKRFTSEQAIGSLNYA